jgi:hypothetical protein
MRENWWSPHINSIGKPTDFYKYEIKVIGGARVRARITHLGHRTWVAQREARERLFRLYGVSALFAWNSYDARFICRGSEQPSLSGPGGMLVYRWRLRQRGRPRCECGNEDLWRRRFLVERGVRPNGVVVTTPALDDDLGFPQRVEDFAVEQFVP